MTLIPAHGMLAAQELISDLRACPELAPYVVESVWLKDDQASTIAALANGSGIALCVGLAEDSLPFAGGEKQGAALSVGLALYVFTPVATGLPQQEEERQSVWYTALALCSRWQYSPPGQSAPIPARMETIQNGVDLSSVQELVGAKIGASVLILSLTVRL